MGTFRSIIIVLLIAFGPAHAQSLHESEDHRFDLAPGGTLQIDSFAGNILVTPSDEAGIHLVVRKNARGRSYETARRWLASVQIEIQRSADGVQVTGRQQGRSFIFALGQETAGGLVYEVRVPRRLNLVLQTRTGAIDVGHDLTGNMTAKVVTGSIFFGRIDGSVQAEIASGDIAVSRASGNVHLRAQRGHLRVGSVFGHADLETGSGGIDILYAHGGLKASAVAGNVKAGFPEHFDSGSKLSASGGDVIVVLDAAANCLVRASSRWGRVYSQLALNPITGGEGQSQFSGRLNDGGPKLSLDANGGHVRIESLPTLLN